MTVERDRKGRADTGDDMQAVLAAPFGKFYNLQKSSSVCGLPLSRWQDTNCFDKLEYTVNLQCHLAFQQLMCTITKIKLQNTLPGRAARSSWPPCTVRPSRQEISIKSCQATSPFNHLITTLSYLCLHCHFKEESKSWP